MLEANGFTHKKTKGGSIFTYDHPEYRVVNLHNNSTVCFNYLKKYMLNEVKKNVGSITNLSQAEKKQYFMKALSKLPFYNSIRHTTTFSSGDYVSVSTNVGITILGEILQFIIDDAGIPSPPKGGKQSGNTPKRHHLTKAEIEKAAKQTALGIHGNIGVILAQAKMNAEASGKILENDWEQTALMHIKEWFK